MYRFFVLFINLFLILAVAALAILPAFAAEPGSLVNVPVSFMPLTLGGYFEYYDYEGGGYLSVPVTLIAFSEDYNEPVPTPGMGTQYYRSVTFEIPDVYYSDSDDNNARYALHARFSIGSTDDLVLASPVQHIEWRFYYQITNYSTGMSHELEDISVTGYDFTYDSVGTYSFQVRTLGNSSDGREFYQAYGISGSDGGIRLSDFDLIDFTLWFRGYPNVRTAAIGFASDCSCDVLVTDPSSGMGDEVSVIGDTANQIADDLSVTAPDLTGVGSMIADNINNSDVLPYLTPPSNSAFFRSLTTVAVSSLSVCLLGYILYGKKG